MLIGCNSNEERLFLHWLGGACYAGHSKQSEKNEGTMRHISGGQSTILLPRWQAKIVCVPLIRDRNKRIISQIALAKV